MGLEIRRETYKDNRDARQPGHRDALHATASTGVTYGSDLIGREPLAGREAATATVKSALQAELAIPLVSPELRIPLVRSVDLQLAGRYEDYSDVGSVAKPKIAGSWDIVDGVRLRASWSQGFRAPNLETLNTPGLERSEHAASTTCSARPTFGPSASPASPPAPATSQWCGSIPATPT